MLTVYLSIGVSLFLMFYAWRGVMPFPLTKLTTSRPMPLRTRFAFGLFGIVLFTLGVLIAIGDIPPTFKP